MVLLTCLVIDAGCISGPNSCPSGMRNWASAQHEASQGCKIAKAEAASSLKIYVLTFTQYHFCHILLVKASHKASSVSSGGKLDSFCWWEEQQNHIWKGHGHLDSLGTNDDEWWSTTGSSRHSFICRIIPVSENLTTLVVSTKGILTSCLKKKKKSNIDSRERF